MTAVSTFTCRRCHKQADLLEEFPGRVCLDCRAQQKDSRPLPTAAEVVGVWTDSKMISKRGKGQT